MGKGKGVREIPTNYNLQTTNSLPPPIAELAHDVARAYGAHPEVRAVVLGGSQAAGVAGPESDLDIYVYQDRALSIEARREIALARAGRRVEVGNEFWEPGDEWIDRETGLHVDVMFRDPRWIEDDLDRVLVRHQAWVGYTTALWHSVRTALPLWDPTGWFAGLQARARGPYPEELRRAIVAKNHPILRDTISSFRAQLARAIERGDPVSVNHRLAALLASYFDILFALNRQTHPDEKRLLAYSRASCPLRPADLEARVNALLAGAFDPAKDTLEALDSLIDGLDELLAREGLLPVGREQERS